MLFKELNKICILCFNIFNQNTIKNFLKCI